MEVPSVKVLAPKSKSPEVMVKVPEMVREPGAVTALLGLVPVLAMVTLVGPLDDGHSNPAVWFVAAL